MKRTADQHYNASVSNAANQISSRQASAAIDAASMSDVNARAAIDPRHCLPFAPSVNQARGTPALGATVTAGMPVMITRPAIDPRYFLPVGSTINQTSNSQASGTNIFEIRARKNIPSSADKESINQHTAGVSTPAKPAKRKKNNKHTKNLFGPISHTELETLLFKNLASSSQQQDRTLTIKLRKPTELANGLPMDIAKQILPLISSPADLGAWAATSRQNYLAVHEMHPFRRASGVMRDISAISDRSSFRTTSSLRSLIEHLAKGGTYDKLLLTPLSDESRLASGFALMGWVLDYADNRSRNISFNEALDNLVTTFSEFSAKAGKDAAMDSLISTIKFINLGLREIKAMKSNLDDFAGKLELNKKEIQRLYLADLETRRDYSRCYHETFDVASLKSLSIGEIALLGARNGINDRNLHRIAWDLPVDSRWKLLRESLLILKDYREAGGGDEVTWLANRVATVCAGIFAALDPVVPIGHNQTIEFALTFVGNALTPDTIAKVHRTRLSFEGEFSQPDQRRLKLGFEQGRVGNTIQPDFFVGAANDFNNLDWSYKLGYTLGRLLNWLDSHPSTAGNRERFQTLCKALNCEAGLNQQ